MRRTHPAFTLLFLLSMAAVLALRGRAAQTCQGNPTGTETVINDNCGTVEYDLNATDGPNTYDAEGTLQACQ